MIRTAILVACLAMMAAAGAQPAPEPGLLFYLSFDHGLQADYAAGNPAPNFWNEEVKVLPGGPKGPYLQCGHHEVLSYWAPGNIYAQRGTLSFYWRSREAVGPTPFPVFRVGYGDHSSWDMVWLRIDYNGKPGFDAFVTDINLGRTRVSIPLPAFPKPDEWVHLALSWDENSGIRFYVNGKFVAEAAATGMFNATLDQFGPHSRAINPVQVQSAYNFDRGGDVDEIRIYDRMLSDDNIAALSRNQTPRDIPALERSLSSKDWQQEWWFRYGWNRPGDVPPPLAERYTTVRKVEIHDAYDLKRWWWRATDGIRETTWPGVYNRSRLPGRNDYFQLPDWDCYALSGKVITFFMPEEPWNHLEISGGAWGNMTLLRYDIERAANIEKSLFDRPKAQEKTFHRLEEPITGQKIRFTNVEQETPIGELSAYYVHPGTEPGGSAQLRYRLTASAEPDNPSLNQLTQFIDGRFPPDERVTMVALPAAAPRTPRKTAQTGLPLMHILIPADFREVPNNHAFSYGWENMHAGLDGIAIDLPALRVKPTHGEYFPLNIQVKDPLWPMRNMLDFTFSVKPGEPHTLWLDTRDRILPNGKSIYLTIAGAGADFTSALLEGAEVRLIFKPWKDAAKEHEIDRFTQVRDNYSNMVEEHVNVKRLNNFARFYADITDLLRVNPDHLLGLYYWYDTNKEQAKPPFTQPVPPAGVPVWAFRQVKDLDYLKRFVNWYIDNRQIEDGELGGGLSDDGDLTNTWPGPALMGATPEKIQDSLLRVLDAFYNNHTFTNGLSTIQADELHSYEEGISTMGEALILNFGSPKQLERAMETSRRLEWLTGVNQAGHRHIKTNYFNGLKMSEEGVWGWQKAYSFLVFQPGALLVQFNGAPPTRKLILELADGLLAHRKQDASGRYSIHNVINFKTDEDMASPLGIDWYVFWAAYKWTGDPKYLQPLQDEGPAILRSITADGLDLLDVRDTWGKQLLASTTPRSADSANRHFAWQMSGDLRYLEQLYADQVEAAAVREYINTEGSLWIDRVNVESAELQRARLGGVALVRNYPYPGHVVSWKFLAPATDQSVAVAVSDGVPDHIKLTAYNLDQSPVKAIMTGWEIDPGKWEMTQGTQGNEESAVRDTNTRTMDFGRSQEVEVTFEPRTTTAIELKLVSKGLPYWSRPDLGIDPEDVRVEGNRMTVTVHSLGAVDAPASRVILRDRNGHVIATASVPALKAPSDLMPKTAEATLVLPANADWRGGAVTVEMSGSDPEITLRNNRVELGNPSGN
ncbi:MAG: LamG-like jellyroll fold domain-containing protein [Bryobacteraceae bacterium]